MSQSSNDEIDLQEIAINVIRYFSRYYKFILVCMVVGGALGYVVYRVSPLVYESKMIVLSDILTEPYANRLAETIDRLIKEENDSLIAKKLNVSPQVARAISSFDIQSEIVESPIEKDGEKIKRTLLIITIEILDDSALPAAQEGILTLLRDNVYVKERVQLRQQKFQALTERTEFEIKGLDSLKKKLFQGKQSAAGKSEMMLIDPATIYSEIVELTEKLMDHKEGFALANSFQLVEGFTPFKKPKSPKVSIALAAGLALGLLGAVAILTIRKLFKLASA